MSDLIKSIALSNISPSGQKDFVTPTGDQYVTAGPTREEIKARTPERGVMGAINDNVIEIANAAAGGVKSISDMVSPGNRVSKFIDENIIKAGEEAQSDQVKAEKMFLRQDLQNAQGAGDEISAYLGYIARNPGLALSQVAGSFAIPGIASAGAAGAATRGALAAGSSKEAARRLGAGFGLGAASATGGAMAGGDAAGGAYELVKRTPKAVLEQNPEYQELLQSMDPDAALEEIATRAARSASVAPGIVGAVLGPLGAERILAGAGRVGQSGSRTGNALKTGAVESGTEGFEEGLTEYSSRSAAAKYNPTIDPMKGVAGAATMGAVMGAGPGVVAGALQAPAAVPDLQPVIAKAAEPNSPLSRAALAGNAGALSQTRQAPAQSGSVDPATRLAELEMISSGTQELTVMGPDGQPVVVPADPGRFFTAEEKAEYDALRAAQAAAQTAAAPADPRGPAADDLVQRVRNLEEGMRNEGWLENLRRDNVQTRDVLADMALARDVNAPRVAREAALERVESATFFANRDAQPAAPMDSIQNYPEFAPTEPAPDLAAREVPSLAPVLGALRDPALRNQISDQDRQQLVYLYNLANNSQGENNVRVNAAQQAFEIIGRYQAPTATPSAQSVAALEQAAPGTPGIAAPASQQNVESQPKELDFLTTAPAPAKATGPLGGDTEQPAFLRKRANVVRQLVDNGFETVARDGSTFFLTNTKTGQKFQLDGPADAQLARKAIKDRVDALANTAAASPQNERLEPTEAQIAAGNYKKSDVIDLNGMRIKIENPQGSTRRGTSPDGKQWETKMAHHYGEFQGTVGADGDKLDVFVGPRPDSSKVFVIDQLNKDGSFDEHKVMMGFTSEEAARQGYLANYEPGWTGLGAVTEMAVEDFKTWAKSRAAKKPAAESGVAQSATTVAPPATPEAAPALDAAAAPDAAVDAAITQPNFTPAESEAPAANQPQFRYINDEGKPRKLRVFRPNELPKQESPARPGAPRPLSQEEAGLIQAVAGLLNKQVVFFTPEGGGRISDGFVIPGQPNTIFIASETTVNPLAVFGHEFFHTLRETNPEAWNAIAAVVRTRVTDAKGFRADRYKDEVANKRGNAELSGEKGGELEELVSDLGGNLLNDPTFWREVFGQIRAENGAKAKGIIAKLAAQINRVIDRLVKGINQSGYRANRYVKDLEDVRAAFRTAMTQYLKDSGINERAMAAEQLKAEQQIKKSADRAPGVTVTGYHFSQQARPTLSTAFYGSGLRGSAREEILSSADGRLRQRLSFYFDKGTGVRPESGVGGIAHKATLTNIYDADIDPMKLKGGNARAFESKVLDAGYNGYLTRLEGTQPGQVILLGQQTITPEVLGPRSRIGGDETGVEAAPAPAPAPVKKGLMSRELNAINVDAIPGATLRAGMLTVPPDSVEQANAELERIGSPVRFSPDRLSDEELARAEYAKIEAQYKGTDQWLKAPNGAPTNLNPRQWVQVRTPSFKRWFGDWEAFTGQAGGVWNDDKGAVSKVVDDNGEPLVVYHGSGKGGFMAFEEPGGEKRGDLGIFTTNDEGMAASYVRRNRARRVEDPGAESDPQAGDQPGIYALFVNIRNPNEADFEGANWDGTRYEQYQVLDAGGDPIYTQDGRAYLDETEAQELADDNDGATVEPATEHYENTDSVVRSARRLRNDGAIIRQVMDDGGGTGYSGDPADIFVAFDPNQVKSADFNGGAFSLSNNDIRKSADRESKKEAKKAAKKAASEAKKAAKKAATEAKQLGKKMDAAAAKEGALDPAMVVSTKPGRAFEIDGKSYKVVTYPKTKDIEFATSRLHVRIRDVLRGSDATRFLESIGQLANKSMKLGQIRGLWAGEREDTFTIWARNTEGNPLPFEASRKLANLLGFAFVQEGAVATAPAYNEAVPDIPAVLIGNGKDLDRSEVDAALAAAHKAGFFGASESATGKGIKILFFADGESKKTKQQQFEEFLDQVEQVQKATGLSARTVYNTKSTLDSAKEYWKNATGKELGAEDLRGARNPDSGAGTPDLFRGVVDNLLAPYIAGIRIEGFDFSFSNWQRVFRATPEQTRYLRSKVEELEAVNKHGVVKKLRQTVSIVDQKDVGTAAELMLKTTEGNAEEQLDVLDRVLAASPDATQSTDKWLLMQARAYGTNDVPMAPNRFIQMYNSDGIYEQLKSLSQGQVADADHGFAAGREFRRLYESGKVKPETTAKLMLWSFLSRGVSPYVQESAFIELVDQVGPFVSKVLAGTFNETDITQWEAVVADAIRKGTGQPGAGTTHNANAFGSSFMVGMSRRMPDGRTKMQYMHDLFSDPRLTGREIRREFVKISEGVGIDNKVISFTMLVIGHDDVIVLDRVQIDNTFNDGRLGDYNLYDGVSRYGYKGADGKTVWIGAGEQAMLEATEAAPDGEVLSALLPGSGMANLTTGVRGLMLYESIEDALDRKLPEIFARLRAEGLRSSDVRPTVGRWHWEGWVAHSGQEASHKTLEALLNEVKGVPNPFADVSAKEGEYGAFSYGTEYAIDGNGERYKLYPDSAGVMRRLGLDEYKELMAAIKKRANGVIPTRFKVSENADGSKRTQPWFMDPRVDRQALDKLIDRFAGPKPQGSIVKSEDRAPEPTITVRDNVGPADAKGLKVTYEVEVEDTGDKAKLTVDAGAALSDYDERLTTMRKLLECLKK
jgi:hypothetical protein